MPVLQLIDEEKKFSPDVASFFASLKIDHAGLDYDIVSVFGSQSTGKSTLLNALFGTEFGVMDSSARKQTTKGIWMGVEKLHSEGVKGDKPLLVLDVEGTDGRERGEDQDFERKSALFALATSEILIINMWEHQVGLYVGANMALLRTVFEVSLSLFLSGKGKLQRSRLMFAIRDYMGVTPLTTLASTLTDDLKQQWTSISKPEGLEDARLEQFFDVSFVGLPNKVLQSNEFATEVSSMLGQIKSSFHPEYHRGVPIDGWPLYGDHVWTQIEMNKDLDLPTHQILVARFRCEEIANSAFANFEKSLGDLNLPFGDPVVIANFGEILRTQRAKVLEEYSSMASRYHQSVYNEKRLELLGRVDGVLTAYFGSQLSALKAEALVTFKSQLSSMDGKGSKMSVPSELTFKDRVSAAAATARAQFSSAAAQAVIDPSFFSYHSQQEELDYELERASEQAREVELRKLLKRASKQINSRLDSVELHFDRYPHEVKHPWDAVHESLQTAISSVMEEYPHEGLGLGGSPEEVRRAQMLFDSEAWRAFSTRVNQITTPDFVVQKMRDRFEDRFKYTPDGLPVVWSPGDDIESAALRSRQAALSLIPVFSAATLSTGNCLVLPEHIATIFDENEEDCVDFTVLLTQQQQQDIERRFNRIADSGFVEAKRSVMQLTTKIPTYIWVIIAVLGWGKLMTVLRNPFLVILGLLLGSVAYFVHTAGMTTPVLNMAQSSFERVMVEGKSYLREMVLTEEDRRPRRDYEPNSGRASRGDISSRSDSPENKSERSFTHSREYSGRASASTDTSSDSESDVPIASNSKSSDYSSLEERNSTTRAATDAAKHHVTAEPVENDNISSDI